MKRSGEFMPGGGAARIVSALLAFALALPAIALTVRSKSDMRLWQTVDDRAAALEWAWLEGADSASLVFSNRITRAVSVTHVVRSAGEQRGRCPHSVTDPAAETLVDATLTQKCGEESVEEWNATLAYVHGAGGGPITVQVMDTSAWKRRKTTRVYGFDPAWWSQPGDSGYDISWAHDYATRITIR